MRPLHHIRHLVHYVHHVHDWIRSSSWYCAHMEKSYGHLHRHDIPAIHGKFELIVLKGQVSDGVYRTSDKCFYKFIHYQSNFGVLDHEFVHRLQILNEPKWHTLLQNGEPSVRVRCIWCSRIPIGTFSLYSLIIFGVCACGTRISFRFRRKWSIVKITIGSTFFRSTHPISLVENAKAFPCSSNISWNRCSSAGKRYPSPLEISSGFHPCCVWYLRSVIHEGMYDIHELPKCQICRYFLPLLLIIRVSYFCDWFYLLCYGLVFCTDHHFFFAESIRPLFRNNRIILIDSVGVVRLSLLEMAISLRLQCDLWWWWSRWIKNIRGNDW